MDKTGQYKADKRKLNAALVATQANFEKINVINADVILPTINAQFDTTGNLSGAGFEDFWNDISKTLEYLDQNMIDKSKQHPTQIVTDVTPTTMMVSKLVKS